MPYAIGIDLGTSFSCAAVFRNGKSEIIENDYGNVITPSYVAFNGKECIVGDGAKNRIASNPCNTIFSIQRLIGHKLSDPVIQKTLDYWPFTILSDNNGCPKILAEYNGGTKSFSPEEILAIILISIKKNAENFLGDIVSEAVITVPVCYNHYQKQAIFKAAKMAQLNILRLLPSPNAAALAYGFNKEIIGEQNVLVFDLGAESCNVSILVIEEDIFEIRSIYGNNHLGGDYFTNQLIDHFGAEIKQKFGRDVFLNPRAFCRLRNACEEAKKQLSSETVANIQIESLFDGIDFYTTISRSRFEELCADLFKNVLDVVEQTFAQQAPVSKIEKIKIHEILVVGGSSRIPKIQKLLSDFFNGKHLNKSLHPDEAAACGAAILAADLSKANSANLKDFVLLEAVSLSLGIEIDEGVFCQIIKRNSSIPVQTSQTFTTSANNQTSKIFKFFEGNQEKNKDNKYLGKIEFNDIPPAPAGIPQIEVTFDVDRNGSLIATVKEMLTERIRSLDFGNLSTDMDFENKENQQQSPDSAKKEIENLCCDIKKCIQNEKIKNKINPENFEKINSKCAEILRWSCARQNLHNQEYKNRQSEIEAIWYPIISKLYPRSCSKHKKLA